MKGRQPRSAGRSKSMIIIILPKIGWYKVKRPPADLYRQNMYRHVTKRTGRKGAHLGIVQQVYTK